MENYICKIASLEELVKKCDYEINRHPNNQLWIKSKENAIKGFNQKTKILYVGILDGETICEATAIIKAEGMLDETLEWSGLFDSNTAHLCAFRTNKEFENKGYFSKLYKFMETDLKSKGFSKLSLGVEPNEVRNNKIYEHLGFTNFIKTANELLPAKNSNENPSKILINYFYKKI